MTKNELVNYWRLRLQQLNIIGSLTEGSQTQEFAEMAVNLGITEAWNKDNWTFRFKTHSLTLTASTEAHELPKNCVGIRSARETDSNDGRSLDFMPKTKFDRHFPDVSSHAEGYPLAYTVYEDAGQAYLKTFPIANISTLYLDMMTRAPDEGAPVPDKAIGLVLACIGKYVYSPGTAEYEQIFQAARGEFLELQRIDSPYAGGQNTFLDDTNQIVTSEVLWLRSD